MSIGLLAEFPFPRNADWLSGWCDIFFPRAFGRGFDNVRAFGGGGCETTLARLTFAVLVFFFDTEQ